MRWLRTPTHGFLAAVLTAGAFGWPIGLLALGSAPVVQDIVVDDVLQDHDEMVVFYEPPAPPPAKDDTPDPADPGGDDPTPDATEDTPGGLTGGSGPIRRADTRAASPSRGAGGSGRSVMYRPDHAPEGPSASRSSGRERDCAEPTTAIAAAGADTWTVERSLLEHYAKNRREIDALARIGRHRADDGEIDGFKVSSIRCGTPLHQAGLRNGDVVHDVNGQQVTTILQALKAYGKVKRADEVEVRITRRGRRMRLRYVLT